MLAAEDVARYFLVNQDPESNEPISNLKIQKLCYYAQGFSLVVLGKALFFEDIERWDHGPVIPSLWRTYNPNGPNPIPIPERPLRSDLYDLPTTGLLERVNQLYGRYSAWELRNKTHAESPWINTRDHCPMTHQSLRNHFETLSSQFEAAGAPDPESLRHLPENPQVMKDLKRGVEAFKSGRMVAWSEVKEELGID